MNILHQQKVEREWSQFWLKLEDVQNKEINWVEISSYHPIVFVIELLRKKAKGLFYVENIAKYNL